MSLNVSLSAHHIPGRKWTVECAGLPNRQRNQAYWRSLELELQRRHLLSESKPSDQELGNLVRGSTRLRSGRPVSYSTLFQMAEYLAEIAEHLQSINPEVLAEVTRALPAIANPPEYNGLPYARDYLAAWNRCEFAKYRVSLADSLVAASRYLHELYRSNIESGETGNDDDPGEQGQIDGYCLDALVVAAPLLTLLPRSTQDRLVYAHVDSVGRLACQDGSSFVYGRSIGIYSYVMSSQNALAARHKRLALDEYLWAECLVALEAIERYTFHGIVAMQAGTRLDSDHTDERLLGMSCDLMVQRVTALALDCPTPAKVDAHPRKRYRDGLIPLSTRHNRAVWSYRNSHIEFQYPIVNGSAETRRCAMVPAHANWSRSARFINSPLGGHRWCGAPRVEDKGQCSMRQDAPFRIAKRPHGLSASYGAMHSIDTPSAERPPCERHVSVSVDANRIDVDDRLRLPSSATEIGLFIPVCLPNHEVEVLAPQIARTSQITVSSRDAWNSAT